MKKTVNLIGLMFSVLVLFGVAKADQLTFTATLTGNQEVPPTGSPGTGNAIVTVDTVTNIMSVNVTFSGLVSPTMIAHIHCCQPPGVNAGVATTVPTFPGFPTGVLSGSYSQTFDLTNASSFNPAFVTAQGGTVASAQAALITGMVNGLSYFNIHTAMFGGGEIRGQLQPVPEPTTLLLLSTGVIGAVGAIRRHRKRS